MTIHNETDRLKGYQSNGFPTLAGGTERFIQGELTKINNSMDQIISVLKALEKRMNDNGLT